MSSALTKSYAVGDPCPTCASGRIGQSGYNFRCANCGWLGPRIATTEAVASVTRIAAPDPADKGAPGHHDSKGVDQHQPQVDGMESTAALTSVRPAEGCSPGGRGSALLTSNLESLLRLLKADGGMSWPSDDKCPCSRCRLMRQIDVELDRLAASPPETKAECPHCREVYEIWANTEGFTPVTAPESYQQRAIEQMSAAAAKGLACTQETSSRPRFTYKDWLNRDCCYNCKRPITSCHCNGAPSEKSEVPHIMAAIERGDPK